MRNLFIAVTLLALAFFTYSPVSSLDETENAMTDNNPEQTASAVFAGGCFWCTESDFEKVEGVLEVISGYTGGSRENPTYQQVSSGATSHVEAVSVTYDPAKISYAQLLEIFWRHVDPTDPGGQFVDRGPQYRSAIFYANESQKRQAEASRQKLASAGIFKKPIATDILPLTRFYPAEDYHQDYYKKSPIRYQWYRSGSGRDQFLKTIWMDQPKGITLVEQAPRNATATTPPQPNAKQRTYAVPEDSVLRERLTPMQYKVTQHDGTEPPFDNTYWNNHEAGIYVDVVSGEPLFSSTHKYDSGTGWPSFTQPLAPENVVEKTDRNLWMVRTEVRSRHGDSHLGHVFNDGPPPTGLRYCINSAALKFIPVKDLEKAGYAEYRTLFTEEAMTQVH